MTMWWWGSAITVHRRPAQGAVTANQFAFWHTASNEAPLSSLKNIHLYFFLALRQIFLERMKRQTYGLVLYRQHEPCVPSSSCLAITTGTSQRVSNYVNAVSSMRNVLNCIKQSSAAINNRKCVLLHPPVLSTASILAHRILHGHYFI